MVFHGSDKKYITILEPKAYHIREKSERAVVFASPSIKLAGCYLFKWDDSWVHQSISTIDNNKITMLISDKSRFAKIDSGGAIELQGLKKY